MSYFLILAPKMVTVDPNDDNIILGIPEDIDPSTLPQEGPIKKVKIIQKHVKKSRMMLNKSGPSIFKDLCPCRWMLSSKFNIVVLED